MTDYLTAVVAAALTNPIVSAALVESGVFLALHFATAIYLRKSSRSDEQQLQSLLHQIRTAGPAKRRDA
jgi:hypothetical protein